MTLIFSLKHCIIIEVVRPDDRTNVSVATVMINRLARLVFIVVCFF